MDFIGFTGTRHGMTDPQRGSCKLALSIMIMSGHRGIPPTESPRQVGVRHGMCVGADAQFHAIAHDEFSMFVVGHPSDIQSMTADLVVEGRHPPRPPLSRNQDIATESRAMIAAPYEAQEQSRGGTWSTIRETRRQGKPLALCLPDGTIVLERIHGLWT